MLEAEELPAGVADLDSALDEDGGHFQFYGGLPFPKAPNSPM